MPRLHYCNYCSFFFPTAGRWNRKNDKTCVCPLHAPLCSEWTCVCGGMRKRASRAFEMENQRTMEFPSSGNSSAEQSSRCLLDRPLCHTHTHPHTQPCLPCTLHTLAPPPRDRARLGCLMMSCRACLTYMQPR